MIVLASAMAVAARLLSAFAQCAVVDRGVGICHRLGRRGRFGFASEQTAFPFADFALEVLKLFLQSGFALDGALMLGSPIVGLQTKFAELKPQPTQKYQSEKEEGGELAKTLP